MHQRSSRLGVEEQAAAAIDQLKNSTEKLQAQMFTVDHLQGVASARFGLAVTAQALGDLVVDCETSATSQERLDASSRSVFSNVSPSSIRELLATAEDIDRDVQEPQLGLFVVKQLVRSKGLDIINKLQEKYGLESQWLTEMLNHDTVSCCQIDACRYV